MKSGCFSLDKHQSVHTTGPRDLYCLIRKFTEASVGNRRSEIEKLLSECPKPHFLHETITTLLNEASQEVRRQIKQNGIDLILNEAYKLCQDESDWLFFASAKLDLHKLQEIITHLQGNDINATKYGESALTFTLKYANSNHCNYAECIKTLIGAGIDVDRCDTSAIDLIANLYEETGLNMFKEMAQLVVTRGKRSSDNDKTNNFVKNVKVSPMDDKAKFIYCVVNNEAKLLGQLNNVEEYVDCNVKKDTLLQNVCKKSGNSLEIVRFLLKKGADPNKTTKDNPFTPLELVIKNTRRKKKINTEIFEEIFNNKKTTINRQVIESLIQNTNDSKLFELYLKSNKVDPEYVYERTGNTLLHYAIIRSNKEAVQNLLKRGSSLIAKNSNKKCVLDTIDATDLEKYFNECMVPDNYNPNFTDINYKILFRFQCLIEDKNQSRECKVVSEIGKRANLEHLLTHPLIHTFIFLMWYKARFFYWFIMLFQLVLFSVLWYFFYDLSDSPPLVAFCTVLTFVNFLVKVPAFLFFKVKNKGLKFYVLERAPLHCCSEMLLIVTIIGSFFQVQFRAFVFIQMTVCFLLTAGYHPRLSKWSIMLQEIFKTFTVLLLFFSLIIVAFSTGFHILFKNDIFFKNFFTSVFRTYIMVTGEFDVDDKITFESTTVGGYFLFLLFAITVSLVIVNFWIGVAVSDINRIEKRSKVNAMKNVVVFLLFLQYVCATKIFKLVIKKTNLSLKPEIDFYVNKEKQFFNNQRNFNLPSKIDKECLDKIKSLFCKVPENTDIIEMLQKHTELLNKIEKCTCFKDDTK